MQTSVHFERLDAAVCHFIQSASRELHIAMCWFSHPGIFQELLAAAQRGVVVELILQYDQINFHPDGLPFAQLSNNGVQVRGYNGPNLMHHKWAIADRTHIMSGSFNWTRTIHADQVIQISHRQAAEQYLLELERLRQLAPSLAELSGVQPRHTHFTKLHAPLTGSVTDLRKRIAMGAKFWISEYTNLQHPLWEKNYQNQVHLLPYASTDYWKKHDIFQPEAFSEWLKNNKRIKDKPVLRQYCLTMRPGDLIMAVGDPGLIFGIGMVGGAPEPSTHPGCSFQRYVQWYTWPKEVMQRICMDLSVWEKTRYFRPHLGSAMKIISCLPADIRH